MGKPIKSTLQMLTAESAALGLFVFVVWLANSKWAASAAAGGLVFIVSNTYFTLYAVLFIGSHSHQWFLKAFFRGQAGKLVLAAVGFVLAFEFIRPLYTPMLFFSFCFLLLIHLIVATKISHNLARRDILKDEFRDF